MLLKQSDTSRVVPFMLVQGDHTTAATGLTPTVTLSKNGGAFGAAAGAVAEVSAGWYKLTPTSADTGTLGPLALHVVSQLANATTAPTNATATTGGNIPVLTAYVTGYTWVTAAGETAVSTASSTFTTTGTTSTLTITAPSLPTGATGVNWYVGANSGAMVKQGFSTTNSILLTTVLTGTPAAPSTNTANLCDPLDFQCEVVAFDPSNATNLGLSGLPTASPNAAGGLPTFGTGAGQINPDGSGNVGLKASGIDLSQLSATLKTLLLRGYLTVTGSTTGPVVADVYFTAGIYNNGTTSVVYYQSTVLGTAVYVWTDGTFWYMTTTQPGVTLPAGYFKTASGARADGSTVSGGVVTPGVYTLQGTATGTPAVVAHGNSVLSGFQPDNPILGDTAGTTTLLTRIPGTVQPQTGDSYARLGIPAGASHAADIATANAALVLANGMLGVNQAVTNYTTVDSTHSTYDLCIYDTAPHATLNDGVTGLIHKLHITQGNNGTITNAQIVTLIS